MDEAVPEGAYMNNGGRFIWYATCADGHESMFALRPHERPPSACGWLLRDRSGAWRESYGTCPLPTTWEVATTTPATKHRTSA